MGEKYNALDNQQTARSLKRSLLVEISELEAALEYDEATDSTHTLEESIERDKGIQTIRNLVKSLTAYIEPRY